MKKVIIISIFLLMAQLVVAEQEEANLSRYIGGAFGISTGYGLSYRYWPGEWGTQVVFAPYSNGEDYTINLGTGIFRTLHETKHTRLFLYGATNGTYKYEGPWEWENPVYENNEPTGETVTVKEGDEHSIGATLGIGPGMEIYIFRNIVLNFMFGYQFSIGSGQIAGTGLGFTFETALYYRF